MSRSERTKTIEEIRQRYAQGSVPVRFRVRAADGKPFGGLGADVNGINHLILQTINRSRHTHDTHDTHLAG